MFGTPLASQTAQGSTADGATEWKLSFVAALKSHQSDSTSDFEIISGDTTFKVHRLVVSLHSNYFKRLCDGTSEFKETSEGKVTLKDDPPIAVKAMVHYFYAFDYPDPVFSVFGPGGPDNPRSPLEAHSQVFTLADKYDVPGLRELASTKFTAAMKPRHILTSAFQTKLAADLLVAIPHVYANTPPKDDRLRKAARATWKVNGGNLLKYVDGVDLEEVVQREPEFAVELLADVAGVEIGSLCEGETGDGGVGGEDGKKTFGAASKSEGKVVFGGGAASSS